MRLICEGCGQPVPIPEGYRRNKIQCACGIICPVPESARQEADAQARTRPTPAAKPRPAAEEEAERWLLDDEAPAPARPAEPPRFRDPEPIKESEPPAKPAAGEWEFKCRRCGRRVRRQGECPSCDADKIPAEQTEPVWWPSVDEPAAKDDDEDDPSPYTVEGAEEVRCPKCSFMLPAGSVLCVRCGFHLKKRKKVAKTYQPIDREWETSYTRKQRLAFFFICEVLAAALGLIGVFVGGAPLGAFIASFLVMTAMIGFLLGTYDRIHLTRDERGRVRLTKTWHLCFFPRQPQTIDVRGFEGIVSGQHRDVGCFDYAVCLVLFVSGIIPGIIWWYLAIYKVTFHVSLSRDHGFPEQIVYSGWNEMQMKEVAFTLRDASGLPYDEG